MQTCFFLQWAKIQDILGERASDNLRRTLPQNLWNIPFKMVLRWNINDNFSGLSNILHFTFTAHKGYSVFDTAQVDIQQAFLRTFSVFFYIFFLYLEARESNATFDFNHVI